MIKISTPFHKGCLGIALLYCFVNQSQTLADDVVVSEAKMSVVSAQLGFKNVKKVLLKLTQGNSEHPATMTLSFRDSKRHKMRKVELDVIHEETDECGTIHYSAELPKLEAALFAPETCEKPLGKIPTRFHVSLADHSFRTCKDNPAFLWEAFVREGVGHCGTGDSLMQIVGHPRLFE